MIKSDNKSKDEKSLKALTVNSISEKKENQLSSVKLKTDSIYRPMLFFSPKWHNSGFTFKIEFSVKGQQPIFD